MNDLDLTAIDLVVDDRDPQAIFDASLAKFLELAPTARPRNGSVEAILLEAIATATADGIYAANRVISLVVEAILGLSRATYAKMVQNLIWATGYNVVAIPMAAGITFGTGFLMTPAIGAVFMSASTIIVAVNALLLKRLRLPDQAPAPGSAAASEPAGPVEPSPNGALR